MTLHADRYATEGFHPVGRDVYVSQQNLDSWAMVRPVEHSQTGERKSRVVAWIREITEDREYRITYPVPKTMNNLRGRRTYTHKGDLSSAIARVRKAANR